MRNCIVVWSLLFSCTISLSLTASLLDGYDKNRRPNDGGPPLEISVNIYVQSFANIEETSMEYKVFMYFRMYWEDDRLAGKLNKTLSLKGSSISDVWIPGPYCQNARESDLGDPEEEVRSTLRIHPNGQMSYSRLTKVTAQCIMDLRNYPADEQECSLIFGSYTYTIDDIIYKWKKGDEVAVEMKSLAQFDLVSFRTGTKNETYSIGDFSVINVDFRFQRRLGYFIIQMYLPAVIIVLLSWIVFWMDRDDIGNRMALGITTILTIMFLMGSINIAMPKVSYAKALDWYLIVSFIFIFLSLVECILVYKTCNMPISKKSVAKGAELEYEEDPNPRKFVGYWLDFASRILFPLLFMVYNTYYWIVYAV